MRTIKPTTIFLSKIWTLALLASIVFKCCAPETKNYTYTIKLILKWLIFLLPTLFVFIKFGTAILINSELDKSLNFKRELLKLAIFISTVIWMINFFIFTLMMNRTNTHFYTTPFFLTMIFGIYFFKINTEQEYYDENILDEDLN